MGSLDFKIGTFNIRFGRTDNITLDQSLRNLTNFDSLKRPAKYYTDMRERPWSERRIPLVEEILWHDVSLLCKLSLSFTSLARVPDCFHLAMQEVLYNQVGLESSAVQSVYSTYNFTACRH